MEPANVNPSGASDPLEQALREPAPRIADGGFSTRVMSAVDRNRRQAQVRLLLIIVAGCAGVAFAFAAGAFHPDAAVVPADLQQRLGELAALAANPAFVLALLVIAAALVYAFRGGRRDVAHF